MTQNNMALVMCADEERDLNDCAVVGVDVTS